MSYSFKKNIILKKKIKVLWKKKVPLKLITKYLKLGKKVHWGYHAVARYARLKKKRLKKKNWVGIKIYSTKKFNNLKFAIKANLSYIGIFLIKKYKKKKFHTRKKKLFRNAVARKLKLLKFLDYNFNMKLINVARLNFLLKRTMRSVKKIFWFYRFRKVNFYYKNIFFSKLLLNADILGLFFQRIFARPRRHYTFLKNFIKIWRVPYRKINIKLRVSGKWRGKMRSRIHTFLYGRASYLTFRHSADYANYNIVTKYVVFSMKVWITRRAEEKIEDGSNPLIES